VKDPETPACPCLPAGRGRQGVQDDSEVISITIV